VSRKVFFIGASKMCTSSISLSLKEIDKRVVHHPWFGIQSHFDQPDQVFFNKYDYFLDGNFHDFTHLDQWFPDSKFVILDRNPRTWLPSLFNWMQYIDNRHMKGEKFVMFFYKLLYGKWIYKRIMTDYQLYKIRANHYFRDRGNVINLDIEAEGQAGWNKLSAFLDVKLEPKWTNVQKDKKLPDWLEPAILTSEIKAKKFNINYPVENQKTVRNKVFVKIMKTLYKDFVHERHLFLNIKRSFQNRSVFNPKIYIQILQNIFRFIRMIVYLMVRIMIVKDRKYCPFIY